MPAPGATSDLLVKLKFIKVHSTVVCAIIKQLECENSHVHDAYPLLGVCLRALASESRFSAEVESVFDLLDDSERTSIIADLREYTNAFQCKWYSTVERNISADLKYTIESFWYRVQIVNAYVKDELPRSFECYEHIFKTILTEEDSEEHLAKEFGD